MFVEPDRSAAAAALMCTSRHFTLYRVWVMVRVYSGGSLGHALTLGLNRSSALDMLLRLYFNMIVTAGSYT